MQGRRGFRTADDILFEAHNPGWERKSIVIVDFCKNKPQTGKINEGFWGNRKGRSPYVSDISSLSCLKASGFSKFCQDNKKTASRKKLLLVGLALKQFTFARSCKILHRSDCTDTWEFHCPRSHRDLPEEFLVFALHLG